MFPEIESRREKAGIDQAALCKRARVHPTTYTARKSGRRTSMGEATLKRLDAALTALIEEKMASLQEVRDAAE